MLSNMVCLWTVEIEEKAEFIRIGCGDGCGGGWVAIRDMDDGWEGV